MLINKQTYGSSLSGNGILLFGPPCVPLPVFTAKLQNKYVDFKPRSKNKHEIVHDNLIKQTGKMHVSEFN